MSYNATKTVKLKDHVTDTPHWKQIYKCRLKQSCKIKRRTRILFNECCERQFTLNENTLPEDSANMYPPEEHQIREDEHGSGEGREKGNATPLHRRREILLLGNQ